MDEREAAAAFAHRMDPNRADVRLALAESRAGLGRTDGLRELLSRCLAPGTPADVRGRAEALLGRLGEPLP
jgi:hypothetical protein